MEYDISDIKQLCLSQQIQLCDFNTIMLIMSLYFLTTRGCWPITLRVLSELDLDEPCQVSSQYVNAFVKYIIYNKILNGRRPQLTNEEHWIWFDSPCLNDSNKTTFMILHQSFQKTSRWRCAITLYVTSGHVYQGLCRYTKVWQRYSIRLILACTLSHDLTSLYSHPPEHS